MIENKNTLLALNKEYIEILENTMKTCQKSIDNPKAFREKLQLSDSEQMINYDFRNKNKRIG